MNEPRPLMTLGFVGWRRTTGCVTLVMACVFIGGWVRSYERHDRVFFLFPACIQTIYSHQGCLLWKSERPSSANQVRLNETKIEWLFQDAPAPGLHQNLDELLGYDVYWQWKWSKFNFGSGRYTVVDDLDEGVQQLSPLFDVLTVWSVPYWSIVVPLTLLSAYLLLSKRPPVKQGGAAPTNGIAS